MIYGRIHRILLRTIANRGVMTITESQECINKFAGEESNISVKEIVSDINKEIRPFHQQIKITNDEITNEEVLVFLSLICNAATKSQNLFSATELEYFRLLLEEIMITVTRQITGINALNLVSKLSSKLTKTDAQRLLDLWCRIRYFDKDGDNYALGVRAIHEFKGYFREHMPDTIDECCLCKQIVFRGVNCPGCSLAVHTRCLNKYLEKVVKWPCCKMEFRQEQLDQLNREDSFRLTQEATEPQQIEVTEQNEENTSVEGTQQDEEAHHVIPEISQRVTRKRKRGPEVVSQVDNIDLPQQCEENMEASQDMEATQVIPEISQQITRKKKRCQ